MRASRGRVPLARRLLPLLLLALAAGPAPPRRAGAASASLAWRFRPHTRAPPPRHFHTAASLRFAGDARHAAGQAATVVLFGGVHSPRVTPDAAAPAAIPPAPPVGSTVRNDTWLRVASLWTPLLAAPGAGPRGRFGHAMSTIGSGRAVLFGGQTTVGIPVDGRYDVLDDLWVFEGDDPRRGGGGGGWRRLDKSGAEPNTPWPAARAHHSMSYCGRGRDDGLFEEKHLLMFGGMDAAGRPMEETWIFKYTPATGAYSWFHKTGATVHPTARLGQAQTQLGRDTVALFGGRGDRGQVLPDTWIFRCRCSATSAKTHFCNASDDGGDPDQQGWTWAKLDVSPGPGCSSGFAPRAAGPPPARAHPAFASFDSETAILFGGAAINETFANEEVWLLTKSTNDTASVPMARRYTWHKLAQPAAAEPAGRYGAAMAVVPTSAAERRRDDSLASLLLFGGRVTERTTAQGHVMDEQATWLYDGGCPPGTERKIDPVTGCNGCYDCPQGTFKNSSGFENCSRCNAGLTTWRTGSSSQTLCTFCAEANSTRGTCVVSLETFKPVWHCTPEFYGPNCQRACNCGSGHCESGVLGSGRCSDCPLWYVSSEDCQSPLWFCLDLLILAALVGSAVACFLSRRRRRWAHRREVMALRLDTALLAEDNETEVHRFEDAFQIAEQDITFERCLAAGGHGEVWRGKYAAFPGEVVAIKKIFLNARNAESVRSRGAFGDKEIAFLAKMPSHPNIVFRVGAGQLSTGRVFLVSEFMAGGDLRSFLDNVPTPAALGWERRVRFARDVADGMAFLHSKGMIHRDLKSLNVLLDAAQHKAKIADFGLSKVTGSHHAILRSCRIGDGGSADDGSPLRPTAAMAEERKASQQTGGGGAAAASYSLHEIAEAMRQGVPRRGRAFRGDHAIRWLVETGYARDVDRAMALGTRILRAGHFEEDQNSDARQTTSVAALLNDKRMLYRFFGAGESGNGQSSSAATTRTPTSGSSSGSGGRQQSHDRSSSSSSGGSTEEAYETELAVSSDRVVGGSSGGSGGASPAQTMLTGNAGSLLWMAPEILQQTGRTARYGLASDVYSFGVLLYEIVSLRTPWDEIDATRGPFWSKIRTHVLNGERPSLTARQAAAARVSTQGQLMLRLMRRAWAADPHARPTFDTLWRELSRSG